MHRFEGHFTLGFADGRNKPDTEITLQPGAVKEAEAFLQSNADSSVPSLARLNRVANLVEGFESPYGMELLATVHWVATHDGAEDLDEVVSGVHHRNARKRKLMTREHIELAHERFEEHGWI